MKYLFYFFSIFLYLGIFFSSAEIQKNPDSSDNESTNNITVIIPQSSILKNPEQNILEQSFGKRKKEIRKILELSPEDKDIENIKYLQQELKIKQELDNKYLHTISSELSRLQTQIDANNNIIEEASSTQLKNSKLSSQIKVLDQKNEHLKLQSRLKENIIVNLKSTLSEYKVLEGKYNNLYSTYQKIKNEKTEQQQDVYSKKLFFLYIFLFSYSFIFFIKTILKRNIGNKYENSFLYFDLMFSIILILALIGFFFYFFPQLYIMLLFISGYLLFINQSIIGSFMGSIIVLKNYNIGDVIKYNDDFGKIVSITPLFTRVMILYDNGILSNRIENIPNILIIKEPIIIYNDPELKEYNCVIYLPIHEDVNLFTIVDDIRNNILTKSLTQRPEYIDRSNSELFTFKYRQEDIETMKISFFWIDRNLVSRKIQRKIFGHIKEVLDDLPLYSYRKNFSLRNTSSHSDESQLDNSCTDFPPSEKYSKEEL